MEEIEIWKDIPEYEGLYQISNYGRVKSLKFDKEKILKFGKDKDEYLQVVLYKDKKRKTFKVHRLVCLAFLKNPENFPYINHKDENKQNNHVNNLEFCNHTYNMNYGTIIERKHKPIIQFTKEGEFIKMWDSIKSASIELKIYATSITACCKFKRKSAYGFIWRYKE